MQRQNEFSGRVPVNAALLSVLLCGLIYPNPGALQQRRPSTKSEKGAPQRIDPFLDPASGPITLPKLLDLLQRVKEDIETEGRILRAINSRGVNFPMTPENVGQIKAAGGSSRLLDLLRQKAPSPPPKPIKKVEPTGSLTLQCRPAECDISIQGQQPVTTKDGAVTISGLRPGEVVVDFQKTGYFGQQQTASVKPDQDSRVMVELEPDNNTQAEFGARLFGAMLDALGGEGALRKDLVSFTASGAATSFDAGGTSTEWNLTLAFSPNRATLETKNSGGALKLECQGEACRVQAGGKLFGKRLKPEVTQNLETALRQFRKYHLPAIVERMISTKTRLIARTGSVPASGEQRLRVESGADTYDIVLDVNLLPVVVTFTSKTGLGSGLSIGFADYKELAAARYPRMTEIKLPEGKQGLRVHLDQLTPQAALK